MVDVVASFWTTIPGLWHNMRAHVRSEAEDHFGITMEQFHSLRRISMGVDSVSKLACDKSLSPSAVSRAVEVLVQKELVVREPRSEDRRKVRLVLTAHGQEQLDALSERIRAWMTGKLRAMDHAELETILLAFAALRKAFH
jgi:DNA-binding MarR family transcriptional regulator